APEGFKVAVALVIDRETDTTHRDAPSVKRGQSSRYVFPDSLHRGLCLAVIHDEYNAARFFDPRRTRPLGRSNELRWLAQALGPCAVYGAYGVPGREIGAWIGGKGHQFAMYPRWWSPPNDQFGGMGIWWDTTIPIARQGAQWWGYVYNDLPWS